MPEEKPKIVKLDKETKAQVLGALTGISTLLKEKKEKPVSIADKMSEKIRQDPSRGVFSALGASVREKAGEGLEGLKKKLDPVNMMESLTGSKLAGTLTAKALGRLKAPEPEDEPKTEPEALDGSGGLGGGAALDHIASTLDVIAIRVEGIAKTMGATNPAEFDEKAMRWRGAGGKFVSNEEGETEFHIAKTLDSIKSTLDKGYKEEHDERTKKDAASGEDLETSLEAGRKKSGSLTPEKVGAGDKDGKKKDEEKSPFAAFTGLLGGIGELGAALGGKKLLGGLFGKGGAEGAEAAAKGGAEAAAKGGTKAAAKGGAKAAAKGGAKAAAKGAEKAAKTATKEGIKKKIAKVIAKKVPKALLGAIGKSVPLLGAAVGLGMAMSRLVEGDLFGAGLEAVSGLGSAATAIPATIAGLVRDVYTEVYEVSPESDPAVGERMSELKQMVEDSATDFLQNKGESAKAPTEEPAQGSPTPTEAPTEAPTEEYAEDMDFRTPTGQPAQDSPTPTEEYAEDMDFRASTGQPAQGSPTPTVQPEQPAQTALAPILPPSAPTKSLTPVQERLMQERAKQVLDAQARGGRGLAEQPVQPVQPGQPVQPELQAPPPAQGSPTPTEQPELLTSEQRAAENAAYGDKLDKLRGLAMWDQTPGVPRSQRPPKGEVLPSVKKALDERAQMLTNIRNKGAQLDQGSRELSAEKEANAAGPVVNNITNTTNNNSPKTTVIPGMPGTRTEETTWLSANRENSWGD